MFAILLIGTDLAFNYRRGHYCEFSPVSNNVYLFATYAEAYAMLVELQNTLYYRWNTVIVNLKTYW